MPHNPKNTLVALLLVGAAAGASAQKVLPGLWESSASVKMQGVQADAAMAKMQQEMAKEMAKMPPEQRKMVEDMMAKQGVGIGGPGAKPNTVRLCITPEQAARDELPQDETGRCKQQNVQRSGSVLRFSFICEGPPPTRGEGEYTLIDPKNYKGRVVVDSSVSGQPQRMEMQQTGRWLGADCGNLKPTGR
ncbi:MAG: DUF3617 domain-containing protein [Chitinophagaceae bacterium]|nr:DUF3617 domain-containing protein [Rubrivivax sp.]